MGSAPPAKPSLVLVHGAWHRPAHFDRLIPVLEQQYGLRCVPISLPSTTTPDQEPKGLAEDTAAVRNAILSELDTHNHDVILIAHSYGGVPSNNSIRGLDAATRGPGRTCVKAYICISALPLAVGQTFFKVGMEGKVPLDSLSADGKWWNVFDPPGAPALFYHDLPPKDQEYYTGLLESQSWRAFNEETEFAGYQVVPTWFLYCLDDRIFTMEWQRERVRAMEEDGVFGGKVRTESLDCSHSPFLSRVEETAAFIVKAADES